jgi:oxygen-dependent protoporphyrinogen oxidase
VEALSRRGEGWTVGLSGGESLEADAVLLAAPAYVVARLVAPLDAAASGTLAGIAYGSTATVFLGYRREDLRHPLDGVGFVVPRAAGRPILAGTWVSSKWDGRAPEGACSCAASSAAPRARAPSREATRTWSASRGASCGR